MKGCVTAGARVASSQLDPGRQFDCGSERCDAVARGFHAFMDRQLAGLGGNGRSCADCHMPSDHFQLSPASVEARFQQLQARRESDPAADDPLFRPIDADDFRLNGQAANDFSNLRENGLIRVLIPLPSNIRLIDPSTNAPSGETHAEVWRMVPSVNNVKPTAVAAPGSRPRCHPWTTGQRNSARRVSFVSHANLALLVRDVHTSARRALSALQ